MKASDVRGIIQSLLGKGLTVDQVDQLVQASVGQKVGAGHALLQEGDRPSGLVLLLSGTVEILKQGPDGARQSLGKVDAPTVLGEMSLITEHPHSATVMAVTDCEYQLLTKAQFQRLLAGECIAAYKLIVTIAEVLAERIARLDRKVVELAAQKDRPQPVEELAAFKQKLFSEWSF